MAILDRKNDLPSDYIGKTKNYIKNKSNEILDNLYERTG
jgi:hypothetical protein